MEGTPQFAHIHFGPGRLGLGLVVLTAIEGGLDIHLVARQDCELRADRLSVMLHQNGGGTRRVHPLPIGSLSAAGCAGDLEPEARAALRSSSLLVTTSLTTAGISQCKGLIAEVLGLRPRRLLPATVFIAAENDAGADGALLERELRALGIDCRRTMVNRLCYIPEAVVPNGGDPPGAPDPRAREVHADGLAEWVIEGKPDHPVLLALDRAPHTRFVPDAAPYELRKRWLVNGGHLALALWARRRRIVSMAVAASEPGRSKWLARFSAPLVRALETRYPELEDSERYTLDHVDAWMRHDDDVSRILRRLTRGDLLPLLDDVERKLVEPLELLRGMGESWPLLQQTFYRLQTILRNYNEYLDREQIENGQIVLTRERDQQVLERYRALLSAVFPVAEANRLVEQMDRAFDRHRARFD